MTRLRKTAALLAFMGAFRIAPVSAASEPMADRMRACAREADAERRLGCFDALVAKLPKIEADQFGLTANIANRRDPEEARASKEQVLPGTIVGLREATHGELVFTLDNQQVWIQSEAESSRRFAVGDIVHIEHGALGSLWLAADKGRKTRVKRLS